MKSLTLSDVRLYCSQPSTGLDSGGRCLVVHEGGAAGILRKGTIGNAPDTPLHPYPDERNFGWFFSVADYCGCSNITQE